MIHFRRTHRRRWLFTVVCTSALTLVVVGKALAASMAEYALLLFLIISASFTLVQQPNSPGVQIAVTDLQNATDAAALAHLNGDRHDEIAGLTKAAGATHALLGLTSSCGDCDDTRSDLRQVLTIIDELTAHARAGTRLCNPDGVVAGDEQCDPLANPSGCPIRTFETFCNDDCECAAVPTQPVPCDLPFPAECNDACECQPTTIP